MGHDHERPNRGRSPRILRGMLVAAGAACAFSAGPGLAQEEAGPPEPAAQPEPPPPQGPEDVLAQEIAAGTVQVSRFEVRYPADGGRAGLPSPEDLTRAPVTLGRAPEAFTIARYELPRVECLLADLSTAEPRPYTAAAIQQLCSDIVLFAREEYGLIGVFAGVSPDAVEFRVSGAAGEPPGVVRDHRGGDTTLVIDVAFADVQQSRSLGSGERWAGKANRENLPAHARILRLSPLKGVPEAAEPDEEGRAPRGDPIDRRRLDRYVNRLNRHPGRRVDVAVATANTAGGATLDYLVAENRPWSAFAQVSNTGTESTDDWRERFGFYHNQLTGRDDNLSLDFVTAGFNDTNAILASYEAPWFSTTGLRWRAYGQWSEFTAADVGLAADEFDGDSWAVGGELSGILAQKGDFFLDLFAGARYEDIRVNSRVNATEGETPVFYPYVGLRADRANERATTFASLSLEWMTPDVADTDPDELEELGRTDVDDDWTVLKWDVYQSFFLEPLLGGAAWREKRGTLAHEVALAFRGQHAFDNRLIPQAEAVAGGLYTVRGYPESAVAGDNLVIGTAEYRFHLPRALRPYAEQDPRPQAFGSPFNVRPPQPGGRPDWDLIFRGFIDAARVTSNNKIVFERDDTLIGAGVGVELQVRRNLSIRTDLGFVLNEIERDDGEVIEAGDSRLHFVATLLF